MVCGLCVSVWDCVWQYEGGFCGVCVIWWWWCVCQDGHLI